MNLNNNSTKNILQYGKNFLKSKNINSFSIDAEVLLMYTLNFTKIQLFLKSDYIIDERQIKIYNNLLEKRAMNMPVQYITENCEFMSLDLKVNRYTLIPRPDTEILVEEVMKNIKKYNFHNILEIGTGSGAIAIAIAFYCNDIYITATDISEKALNKANENSKMNNTNTKINFIQSDIFNNLSSSSYDIIISNPPYIKTEIIKTLSPQVKNYEPVNALDGGEDGLDFYRKITEGSKKYLNNNGMIFFEIGYDQYVDVKNILLENGFKDINISKDLAGLDRVVYATL